ncbi:MAG: CBS domain-containing protein [Lunatimonas sp.]|uniref:DUF294 nucleotidyltransferase-like domain-containing protein n=1 Tax=Lunatimonas sp. TaxID=2060141 RepID=UPI00263ADB6A|nr:DUF294 nucleotidyltransferase-like domain-containing protein [Lunatimonas sp.]MCC5936320.1 CBS domain-containing protein [Lunatimonas sp.]
MSHSTSPGIDDFYSKKISELRLRELRVFPSEMPVHEVARHMASEKISCVFIGKGTQELSGFITDITLRDRVLAMNLPPAIPAGEVMDRNLVAIDHESYVYEALLLMFRTKTRYLLVRHAGGYVGLISRNKILTEPSKSPFLFIQSVKQAVYKEELKRKWEKVPKIVFKLIQRGVRAEIVNQIISTIADTIIIRVIENVLKEIGPPPAKFVFFTVGSEGRMEQTLKTDQDNAIIYEDKGNLQREIVRDYFLGFAKELSLRLDFIGFAFCQGGYMAQNPKWTHSLSHWKKNYEGWFLESSPETVMKYALFFDCRPLYGEFSLLEDLKAFMAEQLENPLERFFYNMTLNALQFNPQLTWFNNIKTFKVGRAEVFDIKRAMSPMVEAIRIYALSEGIFETNTGKRLKLLQEKGVIDGKTYTEWYNAYYYLMALRLECQAAQIIKEGRDPQNYIEISGLTKVQQVTIKEIFKVIGDLQLRIKIEFTKSF